MSAVASAQPSGGSVTVRVVDDTNAALPGVAIELEQPGATFLNAITDETGGFVFANVPAGPAQLLFKLINFGSARRETTVVAGQVTRITVVLRLALNADVIVTGQRTFRNIADLDHPAENLVGLASAASQGAITAAELEARPIMRPAEVLETVPGLIVSQRTSPIILTTPQTAISSSRKIAGSRPVVA